MWKRQWEVWVVVMVTLVAWATGGEVAQLPTPSSYSTNTATTRLKEVQKKFLDVIGNSTSSMHSILDLMSLLHSDTGRELGQLLMEGVILGAKQKNSATLLYQFWSELQERVPPELTKTVDDYRDFFSGMDLMTLPLVWEQLFQKNELGNSLAGMPLGQLVELVQPTASRYGIDIRAFVNSLVGKGDNNVRDLIISVMNNFDLSSLMNIFLNSTSGATAVQKKDTDFKTNANVRFGNEEKPQKGKADKTLQLFRPLVASLLRENDLDLDADAVLKVVTPFITGNLQAQAAPFLSMLGSQAPVIANLLRGGEGQQNIQNQMGNLIGGLGALMAGGGKDKMDFQDMLGMASMFMNTFKPARNKKKDKKETPNTGFDLNTLVTFAGQLTGKSDINIASILKATSNFLSPDKVKNKNQTNKKHIQQNIKQSTIEKQEPPKEIIDKSQHNKKANVDHKPKATSKKNIANNLINVIEPILLSMQTDQKCNKKIKDAISFGKSMLHSRMSSLFDIDILLSYILSSLGDGNAEGLGTEGMVASTKEALAHASWNDFFENLINKEYRETLIQKISPYISDIVIALSKQESQDKLYEMAVSKIDDFFTENGMRGVTLKNFPARLAPIIGMLAKGWNLPFNPTIILVPLRDYITGLLVWAKAGLVHVRTLSKKHVGHLVETSLREVVMEAVMRVMFVARKAPPQCLPQLLCRLNADLDPDSLRAAVTRSASLMIASGPLLEQSDSTLLVKTLQAISGSNDHCEETFPGHCIMEKSDDDSDEAMSFDYEHQEL
nr:uncharacterized protein LOC123766256 [Procambarus clarkii]